MSNANLLSDESTCTRLYLDIRRSKGGVVLLRKDVGDADLGDLHAEAWQGLYLRRGRPEIALDDVRFRVRPIHETGSAGRLTGFDVETRLPGGNPGHYRFTIQAVEHLAAGASRELISAGVLQAGDEYVYELFAEQVPPQPPSRESGIAIRTNMAKLRYVSYPIRCLWAQARRIGPQEEQFAPVFYVQHALELAERYARDGGNQQPPIETGCILVGALGSCPETGEFYVVVVDAYEARHADTKPFSLEYSDRDWTRMQAILRARQSRPEGQADRFIGQAHGHPWLPANGAPPCEICAGKPDVPCARTSCFVSLADSDWSRATFGRQPWQLCHIFGLNARGEHVHKLFGLCNGQLVERGFAVVPEFSPDWPPTPEAFTTTVTPTIATT